MSSTGNGITRYSPISKLTMLFCDSSILADDLIHQLGCGRVTVDLVGGHDHKRQGGVIGNLARLVGEVDAIQGWAGLEDFLDDLLDPLSDGCLQDAYQPIGQQLLQVGSQAAPIAVVDAF